MRYLIFLLLLGCNEHKPPKIERCITSELDNEYVFACYDDRMPDGQQSYTLDYQLNYICTSPDDYKELFIDYDNRRPHILCTNRFVMIY